jgi:predicted HTH domain antitoxin
MSYIIKTGFHGISTKGLLRAVKIYNIDKGGFICEKESMRSAAEYLGVPLDKVRSILNSKKKKRLFSPTLNKEVALR